tara:strand:- start:112 stop:354 length:243 start_codon:yes stop_codon:yes gene_type:complete
MLNKSINIFFFTIFLFLTAKFYLSEQNRIFINKARSSYSIDKMNLNVLKNDTKNIIEYKSELDEFKNKRKKRIWEKLISN